MWISKAALDGLLDMRATLSREISECERKYSEQLRSVQKDVAETQSYLRTVTRYLIQEGKLDERLEFKTIEDLIDEYLRDGL